MYIEIEIKENDAKMPENGIENKEVGESELQQSDLKKW